MSDRLPRVLVVEDDEDILEAVRLALCDAGYEVLVARDGAEGLMRVERDAPALVLLDVVMPKRSGLNVLSHLRRSPLRRNFRIVLVTADDRAELRDFAAAQEVDAFILKPFDIDALVATVGRLLGEEE